MAESINSLLIYVVKEQESEQDNKVVNVAFAGRYVGGPGDGRN